MAWFLFRRSVFQRARSRRVPILAFGFRGIQSVPGCAVGMLHSKHSRNTLHPNFYEFILKTSAWSKPNNQCNVLYLRLAPCILCVFNFIFQSPEDTVLPAEGFCVLPRLKLVGRSSWLSEELLELNGGHGSMSISQEVRAMVCGKNITVSGWFNAKSPPAWGSGVHLLANKQLAWHLRSNNGDQLGQKQGWSVGFYVQEKAAMYYGHSVQLLAFHEWYHIAATYSASGIRIFLNGILVKAECHMSVPTGEITYGTSETPVQLYVGVNAHSPVTSKSPGFAGKIARVRIWPRALR